jgi:hypothetical protein
MASDLLTTVRGELDARLAELRPLRTEYELLVAAAEALRATDHRAATVAPRAPETTPGGPRRTRRRHTRRRRATRAAESAPSGALGRTRDARERKRAPRGAARQALLAALEHGSHTASELASVTAMTGPNIRGNLRRLLQEGTVVRAQRGARTAYALRSGSGMMSPATGNRTTPRPRTSRRGK